MTADIRTVSLLTYQERALLESVAREHSGLAGLPALAKTLEQLGAELVLDPGIVDGFSQDSSNLPGNAHAVARPQTERECAALLAGCFAMGIPVTVSGGRSNLTGSATPEGGVALSLARMMTPEPRVAGDRVCAPVGMVLEDLRNAVREQTRSTMVFPVDPTSRAEASVGGAIACNASGFTPGETGAMRHWVEGLRVLLPDGRLIVAERGQYRSDERRFMIDGVSWPLPRYVRPTIKNAGGPHTDSGYGVDFVDTIIGSEGIFGVVTGCTLRLAPKAAEDLDLFFSLPSEEDAVRLTLTALEHFQGDLSGLGAFEYFGTNCRAYMKHEGRFFRGTDPVALYIRQPLQDADAEESAEIWLELLDRAGVAIDEEAILLLDTPQLQATFLEARHSMPANALERVQHRGTFTIMTDTVVPPQHFGEFLQKTNNLLQKRGLEYLSFGHMGDCHLHFTILPHREQLDDAVTAYDEIVALSASLGGVYSGEHGTGKRKRADFTKCYGEDAADQVRQSKAALDPQFLLNRGNVVTAPSQAPSKTR